MELTRLCHDMDCSSGLMKMQNREKQLWSQKAQECLNAVHFWCIHSERSQVFSQLRRTRSWIDVSSDDVSRACFELIGLILRYFIHILFVPNASHFSLTLKSSTTQWATANLQCTSQFNKGHFFCLCLQQSCCHVTIKLRQIACHSSGTDEQPVTMGFVEVPWMNPLLDMVKQWY